MSVLSGSRADRPGALALVLVLVTLLLAPLAFAPAPAEASVCDLPVAGKVCDGASDVANAVGDAVGAAKKALNNVTATINDVGSTLVDGAKWFGKGVGKIAGGVWNATKPFLKAIVAAGIVVGVAVACSKMAKVVAGAAVGAAATPETAGAGTGPAVAAGAAGAAAMCTLLKKVTKTGVKVAIKVVKNGGKLAKLAKLAAGATGLAALALGTQHAAAWVLQHALQVDKPSAPALGSSWMKQIRSSLNGVAGALLVLAAIVALMFAAFSGRISDVGRIFSGMIGAALVIGIVGSLLFASLQLSDSVTQGTVESSWGQKALGNWKDLGDTYAQASPTQEDQGGSPDNASQDDPAQAQQAGQGTPPDDGKGPWILRFLIAIVTVIAGGLVWVELQIRDGLLMVLLLFSGLLLAGYAFERLRHLATGFGLTMLGVVVAKPLLVITLLLGGRMMQSAAKTGDVLDLATGAGLMLLAGVLGMRVITWMGLQGHLVDKGAARLRTASAGGFLGRRGGGAGSGGNGDRSGSPDDAATADPGNKAPAARTLAKDGADRVNDTGNTGPGPAATRVMTFSPDGGGVAGGGGLTGGAPSTHPDAPGGAGDESVSNPAAVDEQQNGPVDHTPAGPDAPTVEMPRDSGASTDGPERPSGGQGPGSDQHRAAATAAGAAAVAALGATGVGDDNGPEGPSAPGAPGGQDPLRDALTANGSPVPGAPGPVDAPASGGGDQSAVPGVTGGTTVPAGVSAAVVAPGSPAGASDRAAAASPTPDHDHRAPVAIPRPAPNSARAVQVVSAPVDPAAALGAEAARIESLMRNANQNMVRSDR